MPNVLTYEIFLAFCRRHGLRPTGSATQRFFGVSRPTLIEWQKTGIIPDGQPMLKVAKVIAEAEAKEKPGAQLAVMGKIETPELEVLDAEGEDESGQQGASQEESDNQFPHWNELRRLESRRLIRNVFDIPPAMSADIIMDAMNATKRDVVALGVTMEVPDHKTRLAAAALVLDYQETKASMIKDAPIGKPLPTDEEITKRIASNPHAQAAFKKLVKRIEEQTQTH